MGGGGRVRKEERGCGRREEDEMGMWEVEGRSERRERVQKEGRARNKGGGCERGRKGKSEKEGESVEGGGECGMREEDGRGGRGK